jgi:rusticyanin
MRIQTVCRRRLKRRCLQASAILQAALATLKRMQQNRILTATLASLLIIGMASAGYVIAQFASPGRGYAGQYRVPRGSGSTLPDSSLAQFIAQQAGTRLAGKAAQNVPASQVAALSGLHPAGASIDTPAGTITFHSSTVSLTVVAIAPGKPDMTFTAAGLANPAISVPRGARVTVRFINNDTDEAHGWLITDGKPPFGFGQPAVPAIAGAFTGVIGDPTAAGDGANSITFTAGSTGSYEYICPMPGHAQMGMHGKFTVR